LLAAKLFRRRPRSSTYWLQLAATILTVSIFSFGALAELDDPAGAEELGMLSSSPVISTLCPM